MIDDIDYNLAFDRFLQRNPEHLFFIIHGEPMEPDPIRFDAKGLIGIARKNIVTSVAS